MILNNKIREGTEKKKIVSDKQIPEIHRFFLKLVKDYFGLPKQGECVRLYSDEIKKNASAVRPVSQITSAQRTLLLKFVCLNKKYRSCTCQKCGPKVKICETVTFADLLALQKRVPRTNELYSNDFEESAIVESTATSSSIPEVTNVSNIPKENSNPNNTNKRNRSPDKLSDSETSEEEETSESGSETEDPDTNSQNMNDDAEVSFNALDILQKNGAKYSIPKYSSSTRVSGFNSLGQNGHKVNVPMEDVPKSLHNQVKVYNTNLIEM